MKKTALITGASGGIGYELASLIARDKYDLVLVARNASRLDGIKRDFERQHQVSVTVSAHEAGLSKITRPLPPIPGGGA